MLALMVFPALLTFWVRRGIPESPIYLAKVGREAEAREVIDRLVRETGATPEPYEIKAPVTYLPEYLHEQPRRVLRGWRKARRLSGWSSA